MKITKVVAGMRLQLITFSLGGKYSNALELTSHKPSLSSQTVMMMKKERIPKINKKHLTSEGEGIRTPKDKKSTV